ncbi:hypothetical protein SIL73_09735 [Acidithiobacillus thiooxidans]|nr:hypothetical protein [Acidithiobacillus thiooxidans]MDX5934970.1 hypothetical protein [Acidithiobacillus thiooxidans]
MTMKRQCMSCGHQGLVHHEDDQESLSFNGETATLALQAGFVPLAGKASWTRKVASGMPWHMTI